MCSAYKLKVWLIASSTAVERFHSQTVELKGGGDWEVVDSSDAVAAAEAADAAQRIGSLIPNGST